MLAKIELKKKKYFAMSEKIINFASRFYPDLIASSGRKGILADLPSFWSSETERAEAEA